jgi:hypothetical protein
MIKARRHREGGREAAAGRWRGPVALLALVASLAAVAAAVGLGAGQASRPDEPSLRQGIRAILSRSEYTPPPPTFWERLWARVRGIVTRAIEWLLRPLAWVARQLVRLGSAGSPVARWLVTGLLLALLVLILLHIYYMSAGAFRTGRGRRPAGPGASETPAEPAALREMARAAGAAGEFREAVRLLYQAALRRLDRAGAIRYDASRTNWEYARDLTPFGEMGLVFAHLTQIADRALYAPAPVTAGNYAEAGQFLTQLEGLAP